MTVYEHFVHTHTEARQEEDSKTRRVPTVLLSSDIPEQQRHAAAQAQRMETEYPANVDSATVVAGENIGNETLKVLAVQNNLRGMCEVAKVP